MAVKNALLVDDSKSARLVLSRLLEKNNLHVDLVESAEDALSYLKENKPDVIFMDHMMPGMDGLEAAKIINTNPETHSIPVVMCTSKEGEAFTADAKAHGAVDVICKPPSPDAVARVLQLLNEGGLVTESIISTTTLAEAHSTVAEVLQEIVPMPSHVQHASTETMLDTAAIKELLKQLLPDMLETHVRSAGSTNDYAQLDNRTHATENHVAKLQLEMEELNNSWDARISKSLARMPTPSVDMDQIDQRIHMLRTELMQQIDEKFSSLADLINSSSSQEEAITQKLTETMFTRIKSESVSLEQKLDLRLNQLRSKLEEKQDEETDTDHGTASRTMTLITTGLSVLAIVVSVASYFLK